MTGRCVVQSVRRDLFGIWLYNFNYKAVVACRAGVWPRCPAGCPGGSGSGGGLRSRGGGCARRWQRRQQPPSEQARRRWRRRRDVRIGARGIKYECRNLQRPPSCSPYVPNCPKRHLARSRAPRAAPERSPASFPQASCELGHAGQPLVGWGRYVAGPGRARRAQIAQMR